MWVENELEIPNMSTRELDSFLANRSDFDLAMAAVETEKILEAENVAEKLGVKSHELDWFQEDNDSNFMKDLSFTQGFTSEFASSLRRESMEKHSQEKLAKLHNEMIKSLKDKCDAMVVRTHKITAEANTTKTELRKMNKILQKELEKEQQLKQEAIKLVEEVSDKVTILKSRLQVEKVLVIALRIKLGDKKEGKQQSNVKKVTEPEIVVVKKGQNTLDEEGPLTKEESKCGQCNSNSRNHVLMSEHREKRHKQHKCLMCGEDSPNLESYRKHKKKHQDELNVGRSDYYPGNVYNFKCTPCDMSFRTHDNLMDHMSMVHMTESQR